MTRLKVLAEFTKLKLLGAGGTIVTINSLPGKAFVRSQAMLSRYITASSTTTSLLDADGWLRTGDVLTKKDSKYYFLGRDKHLIKVKG